MSSAKHPKINRFILLSRVIVNSYFSILSGQKTQSQHFIHKNG
jgi:hypothetical protein